MMKTVKQLIWSTKSRQFLLQTLFIIFAVLVSIVTVTWILEKSLVKQALELEAEAFITSYQEDKSFPLPHTRNLVGYLSDNKNSKPIPEELLPLNPGLYPNTKLVDKEEPVPVYIRDFDGKRLYLVFEGANVDRLVGVFGLVPLTILLIIIYTSSWIAYKLTWRAASPVLNIARNLRKSGPNEFSMPISTDKLSGETKELAEALDEYSQKIDTYIEREKRFTADVSHELRTPMTVIDGAAQFLQNESELSKKGIERVAMIRRSCEDVNDLISAFFLLARDQDKQATEEMVDVAAIAEKEIVKHLPLIDKSKLNIELNIEKAFKVETNQKALEIIIDNIIGNAVKYTQKGEISVTVSDHKLKVADTGIGISEDILPHLFERHVRGRGLNQSGEGIGLAIVKRLCDQFDWDIQIENQPEHGVLVTLSKV